jgi:type IV pilus assembly protein PilA
MTEATEKRGVSVWVWVLGGCGCAFFGIVLLGIIAAIALPSFLNQANKAKQAEAKTNVGSMTRAQQAYFLEKQKFATSWNDPQLGLGIPSESINYSYKIIPQPGKPKQIMISAVAKQPTLKSFAGAVFVVGSAKEATTVTQICQTDTVSEVAPTQIAAPTGLTDDPKCPAGSTALR